MELNHRNFRDYALDFVEFSYDRPLLFTGLVVSAIPPGDTITNTWKGISTIPNVCDTTSLSHNNIYSWNFLCIPTSATLGEFLSCVRKRPCGYSAREDRFVLYAVHVQNLHSSSPLFSQNNPASLAAVYFSDRSTTHRLKAMS